MERMDSGEEERRLQAQYAQMDDDELRVVADDGYDLTETARRVLQSEISRRGLEIKLKDAPEPACAPEIADEIEDLDSALVEIRQVADLGDAHRLEQILDSARIPYCWGPENLEHIDQFNSSLGDGLALKVCRYDFGRAVRALDFASPPEPEESEETDTAAVCPKCHAPDITFEGRDPEPTNADSKFKWSCEACGYQWEDDGIEQEAPLNS